MSRILFRFVYKIIIDESVDFGLVKMLFLFQYYHYVIRR